MSHGRTADLSPPCSEIKRRDHLVAQAGLLVAREIRAVKAAERNDELARVRGIGRDSGYQDRRDFGPGLRLDRGEVVKDQVKIGRNHVTRGGRVRDSLLDMRIAGRISPEEFAAVECFRDDLAIAAGYNPARVALDDIRVSRPRGTLFPSDTQIDALAQVTAVWAAIVDELKPVSEFVIVSGMSLRAFARAQRMRQETAASHLRAALVVLEKCYRLCDRWAA